MWQGGSGDLGTSDLPSPLERQPRADGRLEEERLTVKAFDVLAHGHTAAVRKPAKKLRRFNTTGRPIWSLGPRSCGLLVVVVPEFGNSVCSDAPRLSSC